MSDPHRVNSLAATAESDPCRGDIRWDPVRSLWNGGTMAAALVLGPPTASPSAVLVFLALAALTLCAGHSVGLHRRLIHRSFDCPKWVERALVWMGMHGWLALDHPHSRHARLGAAPAALP